MENTGIRPVLIGEFFLQIFPTSEIVGNININQETPGRYVVTVSCEILQKQKHHRKVTFHILYYCSKGVRQEYLENKNKKNENYGKQTLRSE